MHFNGRVFLSDEFGSPARVISTLQAYGFPAPTTWACQKWFERSAVPGDWLAILVAALELDTGAPVSLMKYIGVGR